MVALIAILRVRTISGGIYRRVFAPAAAQRRREVIGAMSIASGFYGAKFRRLAGC